MNSTRSLSNFTELSISTLTQVIYLVDTSINPLVTLTYDMMDEVDKVFILKIMAKNFSFHNT